MNLFYYSMLTMAILVGCLSYYMKKTEDLEIKMFVLNSVRQLPWIGIVVPAIYYKSLELISCSILLGLVMNFPLIHMRFVMRDYYRKKSVFKKNRKRLINLLKTSKHNLDSNDIVCNRVVKKSDSWWDVKCMLEWPLKHEKGVISVFMHYSIPLADDEPTDIVEGSVLSEVFSPDDYKDKALKKEVLLNWDKLNTADFKKSLMNEITKENRSNARLSLREEFKINIDELEYIGFGKFILNHIKSAQRRVKDELVKEN